jgi:cell division protein FtsW (lipid II flippase)
VSDNQAQHSDTDVIPPAIFWTIVIAGHFVAGVIFAIPFGLGFSIFLVTVAAAIEVGIWQRRRVRSFINDIAEGSAIGQAAEN